MNKLLSIAVLGLALASCAVDGSKPFNRMSFDELAEYNASVPVLKNVLCVEEVRAGSHIRKTYCSTYEEMIWGLENSSSYLGTINYGSIIDF